MSLYDPDVAEIIWNRENPDLDPGVIAKVSAFLGKLRADDTSGGLHIEKINGAADPQIRTGRVNIQWRALLRKVQGKNGPAHYIYLGTYNHDEAITLAKTYRVKVNDTNGIAELIRAEREIGQASLRTGQAYSKPRPEDVDTSAWSRLQTQGVTVEDLIELGMRRSFAETAIAITDDDALQELADAVDGPWQGYAMLDLAFGTPLEDVRAAYGLKRPAVNDGSDDALLTALRHPAAQLEFAFLDSDEELRAAVEDPDFGRWRVFLHPEQREYAAKRRSGSFRVTGGAGTGKTVILLHRARRLIKSNPAARVVLTTYNTTLADSLRDNLLTLDSKILIAPEIGAPGVYIASVDAIARRVLVRKDQLGLPMHAAVTRVLGQRDSDIMGNTEAAVWTRAASQSTLPAELLTPSFLETEYAMCVLPHHVRKHDEYVRMRRIGRGVSLNRDQRVGLWQVFEGYRTIAALTGTTSYEEKAALAAAAVDLGAAAGGGRPADHVLVDEAQDLSPARLQLLRALVSSGPDDLFLAEDSQQRIYGRKVVLGRYGIGVVGRSRRLRLNYRTTAQTLDFALRVLDGTGPEDLDGEPTEVAGYRSARRGPVPQLIGCESRSAEYTKAADLLSAWIKTGDEPQVLGVLLRTARDINTLVDVLTAAGVPARHVANRERPASGYVSVMTMHRAKGMEFRRVVIVGMSAGGVPLGVSGAPEAERADALQQERSLVYVAATRARDQLVITWSGRRSSLVPEVKTT